MVGGVCRTALVGCWGIGCYGFCVLLFCVLRGFDLVGLGCECVVTLFHVWGLAEG